MSDSVSIKRFADEKCDVENDTKKAKMESDYDAVKTIRESFQGTHSVSILNEKRSQKVVFLQGKFEENSDNDAVIILEKRPFDLSPEALSQLLSTNTKLTIDLQNDIYSTYNATPIHGLSDMKATVIYPATKKHIEKYKKQNIIAVEESAEDYDRITRPYLERQFENNVFNIQWVYNILEHKQEKDRILFEDSDPELGFVLLPDMKWDGKDSKSLYVIAIPHQRGIKSLRDLTKKHVPLLENIAAKSLQAIQERFKIGKEFLRFYFHYQPSYYHLHVHINHLELDIAGTSMLRAHLLKDVIENVKLSSDYYQQKTLSFTLPENNKLLAELQAQRL